MVKQNKPSIPTIEDNPSQEAIDLLERIEQQNTCVRECERRVELLKEELKAAKEDLDEGLQKLRGLCAARSEQHPLFDADEVEA